MIAVMMLWMEIIRDLYDFARSNPSPESYLQDIVNMYAVESVTKMEETAIYSILAS